LTDRRTFTRCRVPLCTQFFRRDAAVFGNRPSVDYRYKEYRLFFFFVNNNVIENIKNRGSHKGGSRAFRRRVCGERFILLRREIRKTGEEQEGKGGKRGEIRFFIRKIRLERV
jgi:hypothetical protein